MGVDSEWVNGIISESTLQTQSDHSYFILTAIYTSYVMIACIALLLFMACYYQPQADPLTPYCSFLLKRLSKGYLMSYNSQNFYLIQYSSHLLMLP